jgi:hypothetical protein
MAMLRLGLILTLAAAGACGNNGLGSNGDMGPPPPDLGCVGRECLIDPLCGTPTTLSGTVTIPAGTLPLANAVVYIPNGNIPPPPQSGAVCDCDLSEFQNALAITNTDAEGRFFLVDNVPTGDQIPLIIRLGKWRREVTIPTILPCTANQVDPALTRLPRNQSEGNIPKIALSTGAEDALECLLRSNKLGLDDAEFSPPDGPGRVNLFAGGESATGTAGTSQFVASLNGGALFPSSNPWWNDVNNWNRYDLVMLACEGAQNAIYKSMAAHASLLSYLNGGGRVFLSHWQNVWIADGPLPLSGVATFTSAGGYAKSGMVLATINQNVPTGQLLASWLEQIIGAGFGQLPIYNAWATVTKLGASSAVGVIELSDPILTMDGLPNPASQYFFIDTPISSTPAPLCGRLAFTDLHASGNGNNQSSPTTPFPSGCVSSGLLPQEQALIFMLFDLMQCPGGL